MANRYFVGDVNDDWDDADNWSATSGGAGGAGVPTSSDDVYLDGYSPDCTISSGGTHACNSFDCTGYSNTFSMVLVPGPALLEVHGATFKLVAGMTFSIGSGKIDFKIPAGALTLTTAGKTFDDVKLSGDGTVVQVGDMDINGTFEHTAGSWDANGNNMTIDGQITISGGTWQLITGTIQVRNLTVSGSGSISASTSVMIFAAPISTLTTINLNGQSLYDVQINGAGGSQVQLGSNLTCNSLDIDNSNDYFNLNGYQLDVNSGDFTISAGIFNGGAGNIRTRGNFYMTGGIVTMTSGIWTANKDFERTTGTLSHNNGTLYMDRTTSADFDLDINGAELYNLTIDYAAYAVDIDSDFTIVAGGKLLYIGARGLEGTATITLKGDMETRLGSTNFGTRCTILVNGTGAQEIKADSGTKLLAVSGLIIDKASGTLSFVNGIGFMGDNLEIEYKQGTIDWSACTEFMLRGHHSTIKCTADWTISSGPIFNVYPDSFNFTVDAGTLILECDWQLTQAGGIYGTNGGIVHFKGSDADFQDPLGIYGMTLDFVINGTGAQTLRSSTGTGDTGKVKIDKPSGTLTITGTIGISADTPNQPCLEYVQGTVVASGSTIILGGGDTRRNQTVKTGNMELGNVEISPGSSYNIEFDGKCIVKGNFLITQVDNITQQNTGYVEIHGNFESSDVDVNGDCPFHLVGTGTQTIKCNGTEFSEGDFVINKPSGEAILAENFAPPSWTGDLIITNGIFSTGGYNVSVEDLNVQTNGVFKWKGNETITVSGVKTLTGTVEYYDAAVEVTLDDFATTFGGLTLGAGKTHKVTAGVGNGIVVTGSFGSRGTLVNRAILRSTSEGTQWELDLQGTSALGDSVDVKDSDASAGNRVWALNSEDSGNNTNWFFGIGQGGFGLFRPNSFRYNRGICPKQLG